MKEKPLVSVGIPTYNRPEGLRRTLECITGQTYQNIEIIISNNCSPDPRVEEVILEFQKKDKRIQYFKQVENIFGKNFPFVLEKSKGVYFMWAADDDEWESFHIERLMATHFMGDYILVGSKPKYIDVDGRVEHLEIPDDLFIGKIYQVFKRFLLLHHWAYFKAGIIYGIYKRNEILYCTDFFFKVDPAVGSDLAFLYSVLSKGKACYLKDVTWTYHYKNKFSFDLCKTITTKVALCYLMGKNKSKIKQIKQLTNITNEIIDSEWKGLINLYLKCINKYNEIKVYANFIDL